MTATHFDANEEDTLKFITALSVYRRNAGNNEMSLRLYRLDEDIFKTMCGKWLSDVFNEDYSVVSDNYLNVRIRWKKDYRYSFTWYISLNSVQD